MDNGEKMNFKISTGLKNIIGKELITSEVVAVFELVKNSFDAGAKNVSIQIDLKNNKMVIADDGIGMSKYDIENKWLFVAYSEKKDINESRNGRRYVGAKGIGRFACDRLGEKITIISKTVEDKSYNCLDIEWGEFEKNNINEFMNVPVSYYAREKDDEYKWEQGTILNIVNLRDKWDEDRINKLRKSLEKLVNPFSTKIDMEILLSVLSDDEKLHSLSGPIKNSLFDALKEKTVYIKSVFDEELNVELNDRGKKVYSIKNTKNSTGLSGITICIYYLNTSAKNNFTRLMGIEPKNYGSIFIYKNDFRIYPYGELNYDTLGLDSRKTQGYNRFLGNREIVGYISIIDPEGNFIEVSSRDRGFIENAYYKLLEEVYMEYAHKPLEKYIRLIKWGFFDNKEITFSDVNINDRKELLPTFIKDDGYDIQLNSEVIERLSLPIEKQIKNASNDDDLTLEKSKELLKKSAEIITDSKKTIKLHEEKFEENSKKIDQLENQNVLLKSISSDNGILQAEITHHISKMSNELDSCIENIAFKYKADLDLMEELSKIRLISDKMRVFNEVILKGNFSSKGKKNINLFEYFEFYFSSSSYIKRISKNKTVKVSKTADCDVRTWEKVVDVYEISVIIDNMTSNAFDMDANIFDISFDSKNKIHFFTDTVNVLDENKDKIFELGFSTKDGGTGIGLYQVRKIVKKYGWSINVFNKENGVEFVIEVR